MIKRDVFEASLLNPIEFWSEKSKEEVQELLGEKVSAMVGFNQRNPHHCYTLFDHILHVVDNISTDAGMYTKVAAFFHDIGKPDVAMEKKGNLVFYGHAKHSVEIAEPILKEIGYSDKETLLICFYIEHHDDFISWVLPSDSYDHNNPYLIEITKEHLLEHMNEKMEYPKEIIKIESEEKIWRNILELCRADALSQAKQIIVRGRLIDSANHKKEKVVLLQNILPAVIKMKQRECFQ